MAEKKHFLDNSAEYFHTLHQSFYLAVSGPLVLFCVVYINRLEQGSVDVVPFRWWHVLVMIGMVLGGMLAYRTYRQRFQYYDTAAPFRQRLRFFHRTAWRKYAWLVVVNLLPVLGLYFIGGQFFLGLYAIALVLFSLNRPTLKRVAYDLQLSEAEREQLRGDQDFPANDG